MYVCVCVCVRSNAGMPNALIANVGSAGFGAGSQMFRNLMSTLQQGCSSEASYSDTLNGGKNNSTQHTAFHAQYTRIQRTHATCPGAAQSPGDLAMLPGLPFCGANGSIGRMLGGYTVALSCCLDRSLSCRCAFSHPRSLQCRAHHEPALLPWQSLRTEHPAWHLLAAPAALALAQPARPASHMYHAVQCARWQAHPT